MAVLFVCGVWVVGLCVMLATGGRGIVPHLKTRAWCRLVRRVRAYRALQRLRAVEGGPYR